MKKRVAQIITVSEMGGAQKHVFLLTKSLIERGYEVDVIAQGGGDLVNKIEEVGGTFINNPYMVRDINPVMDIKNILYLKKLFKERKYDIVHCHSSKGGLVGRIGARFAGVKSIIYTAHGFVFNEPMGKIKRKIYIAIEYIGSKFGKKIIAVSKKDYYCGKKYKLGNEKNLYCIGNAIEEVEFNKLKEKDLLKEELGLNKDYFVVGMVSNFYETKGHRYLIDAIKKLYDEGFKFYMIFAGEGYTMDEMIEKSKGYDLIKFLGYRNDNLDLMNIFDIFMLSSVKEGMPYVILEAMNLGKPVIATKVGALTNMIESGLNGILIESKNSNSIYIVLKDVLKQKYNLNLIGENGKEYINKNYSFSKFMDDIIKVYEE